MEQWVWILVFKQLHKTGKQYSITVELIKLYKLEIIKESNHLVLTTNSDCFLLLLHFWLPYRLLTQKQGSPLHLLTNVKLNNFIILHMKKMVHDFICQKIAVQVMNNLVNFYFHGSILCSDF